MLNRRFLRIKVMQALYAYIESGETNVNNGIKILKESIEKLYELFIWQLSFLVETKRYAENKLTENKHKYIPTYEDLHPNMKYVNNRLLNVIEDNVDFRKHEAELKINWADDTQDVVKKYYTMMKDTEEYKKYMADKNDSFAADRKFIVTMISNYFADLDVLQDFYEDKSIYFCDDYHLVSSMLLEFFNKMKNFDVNSKLPEIYKTEADGVEANADETFIKDLFRATLDHDAEFGELIAENTNNWEKERICLMDMIILKMALTEFVCFPYIPVKVTMNEYIEISKYFSTPKSKIFVNGILDKLAKKLNDAGRINKMGLGLLEK
ncbi:MAG: transcription antitermination factor NusB [Bacteroidales bacterium]|nr:transcription antitermination factor NusB [Bacteroidales bacterium]